MAQATGTELRGNRRFNLEWFKAWLARLIFVALGVIIGLYILAPRQVRASDTYYPTTFANVPTGIVELTGQDGSSALLPVRIADTTLARSQGLKDVGPAALNNVFFLYAQTRETTTVTSYNLTDVRANLEFAIINAEGEVVAIQSAPSDTTRLSVTEKHRWVLAAKTGMFEPYGIQVGSRLDPESVRKLNF
jgi:uncharacterized membrane protein (UPF0127 family)